MKSISFEVRAMLFDMDGTLVDSTPIVERTWTRWALERNLNPDVVLAFAHGRPTADTVRMAAPELDAATEAARLLVEEELDPTPTPIIPGALDAVTIADRHAKWAVVTSASHKLARLRLTMSGYPKPPVLISADDVLKGKPDPEGFLRAIAELKISAEDCVVFEDTPAGLEAGSAAGAKTIGLATTFNAADLPADIVIGDFTSLELKPAGDGRVRVTVIRTLGDRHFARTPRT
jgi:mannitol-1-/sugar-/sorbitol-6-phosphatase